MSLAKIHAFTAWVNFRLDLPPDKKLNNVLTDLFQDLNWQRLIETITGAPFDKIGTFTGLSQVQKALRLEWILEELKSWKVIEEEFTINPKLLAARNSEEIFSLLFKLVSYDAQFLWKRMEYFQLNDTQKLSLYEFKITPERPATAKPRKFKVKKDLLAGFGGSSEKYEEIIDENEVKVEKKIKLKDEAEMISYKRQGSADIRAAPKPTNCILAVINGHFKMFKTGRNMKITKITDMCDIKVLCNFFNALISNSFTDAILPNDRFSVNTILRTLEKVLRINSDFDATDLNSKDTIAITTYFTQLFLGIFRFRQIMKVLEYKTDLEYKIRFNTFSMELFSNTKEGDTMSKTDTNNKKNLMEALNDLDELKARFDIKFCEVWKAHKINVIKEMFKILRASIDRKYFIIDVPHITTINDFCNRYLIYTRSMKCGGYYQLKNKEVITEERNIILRNVQTDKFIIDSNKGSKSKIRSILKLSQVGPVEINPNEIVNYEIFVDANSKNKSIITNDKYLYKLFPESKSHWQELLLEASTNNDLCTIKVLFKLFEEDKNFVNYQEPESSNSALHIAALSGFFDVCLCLLERGADVNIKNRFKYTPLFSAMEEDRENICGLLLEWGADIHIPNARNVTVVDSCKNSRLRLYIETKYKFYTESQQTITDGDKILLQNLIHDHRVKNEPLFLSIRSRCIYGSTLLHTASHFSSTIAVKELLMLNVDVNLRDYKGASALHRASDLEIIDLLIESGIDVTLCDNDGNRALHSVCYGEEGLESQIDKIKILINQDPELTCINDQLLMPIHCAAMQGRCDVIELLLDSDQNDSIVDSLFKEDANGKPQSLVSLSLSNGFVNCAIWILDRGFTFKENEADAILKQVITGNIALRNGSVQDLIDLLIHRGNADINRRFPPLSQTILHIAAGLYNSPDILEILIQAGSDVDATDDEHCTPLFVACKSNNKESAKILIENEANINVKNNLGQTPFDYIPDYMEWINCKTFNEDTIARLKAYNLKQARNTIRSIDKRMNKNSEKDDSFQLRQLESRLDQNLIEDIVERAKSQLHLRPRSIMY